MQSKRNQPTGVRARHARSCRFRDERRCNCRPSYEAAVFSKRDGKKVRKSFPTITAAKAWRADALSALNRGQLRAPTRTTVRELADEWLAGVRDGTVRSRNGRPYKPSALRGYARVLRLRVLPALGDRRLSDVRRLDVQDLVDRMLRDGHEASTINNTLDPLRAIFRYALRRELVAVNPCADLDVPRPRGRRERIASPGEARALIDSVPVAERALWATAFYAGLRRGELRALRWTDLDLAARELRVSRGWDDLEGEVEAKTEAGRRTVPLVGALVPELAAHKLRTGRDGDDLVFGFSADVPFEPSTVRRRALAAWKDKQSPIGLHEARHTFASTLIAAGVNAKAITEAMGHASVTMTFDRYGHLMPDGRDEARARVDAYLASSG